MTTMVIHFRTEINQYQTSFDRNTSFSKAHKLSNYQMYEAAEGTLIAADNSYGFRITQITVFSHQSINKGKSTFGRRKFPLQSVKTLYQIKIYYGVIIKI